MGEGGDDTGPELLAASIVENTYKTARGAVDDLEIQAERVIDAPEGHDESAHGRQWGRPQRKRDEGKRRECLEHALAAHGREEARERRPVVRSIDHRDAREAGPPGQVFRRHRERDVGRGDEPRIQAATEAVPDSTGTI